MISTEWAFENFSVITREWENFLREERTDELRRTDDISLRLTEKFPIR